MVKNRRAKILDSGKMYYFSEVAKAGSFRLAAVTIGVSQPLLTRQIQALEEELGVALLHRGHHSTRTTEAGDLFLERCHVILKDLEVARSLVSSVAVTPSGLVTLAVLTSLSGSFSVRLLNIVEHKLPNVNVRITEGTSRHVEERLLSGQADVGVLIKRPFAERFILEEVLTEPFCLFGRSLPVGKVSWSLKDIEPLPLVLQLPPFGTRWLINEAARKQGATLRARFEVDSPALIRDLLLSNDVYAIMPRTAFREECQAGTLRAAKILNPPQRTIVIATLRDKTLSAAARAVAHEFRRLVIQYWDREVEADCAET